MQTFINRGIEPRVAEDPHTRSLTIGFQSDSPENIRQETGNFIHWLLLRKFGGHQRTNSVSNSGFSCEVTNIEGREIETIRGRIIEKLRKLSHCISVEFDFSNAGWRRRTFVDLKADPIEEREIPA